MIEGILLYYLYYELIVISCCGEDWEKILDI